MSHDELEVQLLNLPAIERQRLAKMLADSLCDVPAKGGHSEWQCTVSTLEDKYSGRVSELLITVRGMELEGADVESIQTIRISGSAGLTLPSCAYRVVLRNGSVLECPCGEIAGTLTVQVPGVRPPVMLALGKVERYNRLANDGE